MRNLLYLYCTNAEERPKIEAIGVIYRTLMQGRSVHSVLRGVGLSTRAIVHCRFVLLFFRLIVAHVVLVQPKKQPVLKKIPVVDAHDWQARLRRHTFIRVRCGEATVAFPPLR